MSNSNQAHFECIIGKTGCGKTTVLKKRISNLPAKVRKRSIVWSPKEEIDRYVDLFSGSLVVRSVEELLDVMLAAKGGEFHAVFVPYFDKKKDRAAFSAVCRLAMKAKNVLLIAEELHTCTDAGNATDGWAKVSFMGRAFGLYVFGLSQRPASLDKDFLGALSWLHVGELAHPPDRKVMAEYLGVDVSELDALCLYQGIQKDFKTKTLTRVQ